MSVDKPLSIAHSGENGPLSEVMYRTYTLQQANDQATYVATTTERDDCYTRGGQVYL